MRCVRVRWVCIGVPGSEAVLARRFGESRWEDVADTGVAESWHRASKLFNDLAGVGIIGAAKAAAKLTTREEGKQKAIAAVNKGVDNELIMGKYSPDTPSAAVIPPK
jgi:hypothetical protein